MKTTALILLTLVLVGCSNNEQPTTEYAPSVFSKQTTFPGHGESTPFVWNGKLMYMTSTMTAWNSSNRGKVELFHDDLMVGSHEVSFSLGAALVSNGTLYVIGSSNWDKEQNSFLMISTTDLVNWTPEQVIDTSPTGIIYYNQSVVKVGSKYVMTYEYCSNSATCKQFKIKFKESTDLLTWTDVGSQFYEQKSVGCPTLKYEAGTYLLFYGEQIKGREPACETKVARSTDLNNWEYSQDMIVTARDGSLYPCDSDFDLVEFNNELHGIYIEGNQKDFFQLRKANYPGTLNNLMNALNWRQ